MDVCGAGSAQVALSLSAGLPPLFPTEHSLVPQSYAGDNLNQPYVGLVFEPWFSLFHKLGHS